MIPAALKKTLREKLLSYMIPARWMVSETLPRNVNGKIDRSLLRTWFKDIEEGVGGHAS